MLQLCPEHTDQLRQKIEEMGLGGLVARDLYELNSLWGMGERDPFYSAYQRIMLTLLMNLGIEISESGLFCPLCFVVRDVGEAMVDEIIGAAVRYEVEMAK